MYLVLKLSKILLPGILLDLQLLFDVHFFLIIHQEILVILLLTILLFVLWPLFLEEPPETPGAEDSSGQYKH